MIIGCNGISIRQLSNDDNIVASYQGVNEIKGYKFFLAEISAETNATCLGNLLFSQ